MRISTKIILYVILPIFAVNLVSTFANFYADYNSLKASAEGKFISETEFISAKVAAENMRGVALAKSAARAASILFGNRVESVRLIKDILEESPAFVGASVGYEVNADFADFRTELGLKNLRDGKDVKADGGIDAYDFLHNKTNASMDEWIAKSEGGRFVAYWSRLKGELLLEPLTGMDTAMYSAGLRKKTESGDKETFVVTEPYIYSNNVMMVEYSAPIFSDGKFCGQVAFDRDLSSITSLVNSMKTFKGGDIFIISAQGRIIASTKNDNLRTLSLDDLLTDENGNFTLATLRDENGQLVRDESSLTKNELSKYSSAYRDMLKSAFETAKNSIIMDGAERRVTVYKDATTDKTFFVSQSLIRPGNWAVINVAPEDELLSGVYSSAFREFSGVGAFLLAVLLALSLLRGTFARVRRSSEIADMLAVGNYRIDVSRLETSDDEVGRILRSLSRTAARMRAFTLRVKFAGLEISDSTGEMDYNSERYSDEIREIGATFSTLSDSVKQLGDTSRELCEAVDSLSENALAGAHSAGEGKRKISEMESALSMFSRGASSVSRRLSVISERVENVASAVATISKVSEETNLLSLNASIEAEKAGVYGVGFAVVAGEIGRLAEQSASAVEDIETIVKDMRAVVSSGVSEMDKFSEEIRTSGADFSGLISDMDELSSNMLAIAPQIERLSTGVQSQRFDVSKIGDTLSGLGDAMRQAALILREISSSRVRLRENSEKLSVEVSAFDVEPKGGA